MKIQSLISDILERDIHSLLLISARRPHMSVCGKKIDKEILHP